MGKKRGGEGQIGFAQALFLAGSRSLILSLWKVDDEATAILMSDFYREYAPADGPGDPDRGRPSDPALRRTACGASAVPARAPAGLTSRSGGRWSRARPARDPAAGPPTTIRITGPDSSSPAIRNDRASPRATERHDHSRGIDYAGQPGVMATRGPGVRCPPDRRRMRRRDARPGRASWRSTRNGPLVVRQLDRLANRDEQLEPIARGELIRVAVPGDRRAPSRLHDEVGPAGVGRAHVEHAGDMRMIHQGECLPLGLEPAEDLVGIHARPDNLEHAGAGPARPARRDKRHPCHPRRSSWSARRDRSEPQGLLAGTRADPAIRRAPWPDRRRGREWSRGGVTGHSLERVARRAMRDGRSVDCRGGLWRRPSAPASRAASRGDCRPVQGPSGDGIVVRLGRILTYVQIHVRVAIGRLPAPHFTRSVASDIGPRSRDPERNRMRSFLGLGRLDPAVASSNAAG